MGRTVQLVGGHPSVTDHPIIPGAERWLIGSARDRDANRPIDRVFDLHSKELILRRRPEKWAWYRTLDCPVYLLQADDEVFRSVPYPLLKVMTRFEDRTGAPEVCFAGTVSYLMALALYEGVDQIDLAGIPLRGQYEYTRQREAATYWMGRARGMGVHVTIQPESGLGTVPYLYGYGTPTGAPDIWREIDGVPGKRLETPDEIPFGALA